MRRQEKRKATSNTSAAVCADLDIMSSPEPKKQCLWVAGLNFEHERILLSDAWLDDKLVNAGQTLIKARFPNIHGFQDVSLGQTLAFDIMKEGFVQVLHTGRGHWITVSTIGCHTAEVDVYDSMPPSVNSSLQNQVAALFCSRTSNCITLR